MLLREIEIILIGYNFIIIFIIFRRRIKIKRLKKFKLNFGFCNIDKKQLLQNTQNRAVFIFRLNGSVQRVEGSIDRSIKKKQKNH